MGILSKLKEEEPKTHGWQYKDFEGAVISPSGLRNLFDNPRTWYRNVVLRERTFFGNVNTFFGTLVHKFAEDYYHGTLTKTDSFLSQVEIENICRKEGRNLDEIDYSNFKLCCRTLESEYLEIYPKPVEIEGKFVKQSGGKGQYGHVWLKMEPNEAGKGFEFIDAIKGGTVPREFIPAVEKGLRETLPAGVVAGYPVVDVKVTLFDGSYHDVDSNENAFKMAASMAFKDGMRKADPILLEPMMAVEVETPEDYMGDVMGDLSSRRGMIQGMEDNVSGKVIRAEVPLAEMFGYSTTMRSLSQGRATYSMEFKHYTEAPRNVAEAIVNKK